MSRKVWIGVSCTIALIVLVAWVMHHHPTSSGEDRIRIGAILPLTKDAQILGTGVREGLEIAVDEINTSGGINGRPIEVLFQDSQNDAREGTSAMRRLIDLNKVPVVITAMSSVTKAAIPIADERKVVLFGTVTAEPGLTRSSDWAFRAYYTTDAQGSVAAEYLTKARLGKVAVLYVKDDYGVSGRDSFQNDLQRHGGQVVATEGFDKGATDIRAQVTNAIAAQPQAVIIISYGETLATAVKRLRELGYRGCILSYTGLIDPDVIAQAGPAAEGALVVASSYDPLAPDTPVQAEFVRRYRERFRKPPSHYAAFGHDSLMLLADAMKRSGTTAQLVRSGLLSGQAQPLVLGSVSIGPDREVRFPYTVKVLRNGVPVTSLASKPGP